MTESRSRYQRRTLALTLVSLVIVGYLGLPAAAASVPNVPGSSETAGNGSTSSQYPAAWTRGPGAAGSVSPAGEVSAPTLSPIIVSDRESASGAEDDATRKGAEAPPVWMWLAIAAAAIISLIVIAHVIRRVMHGPRPEKADPTSMEWLNKKHGHGTAQDANE